MLQTKNRTRHRIICDDCGCWSVEATSSGRARQDAKAEGFHLNVDPRFNGLAWTGDDLCPDCYEKRQGQQGE